MMMHQSFNKSRRSRWVKAKRAIQLSVLLAVLVWLIYQVKHSHDKNIEYSRKSDDHINDGRIELYLGRKGHPGYDGNTDDRNTVYEPNTATKDGEEGSTGQSEEGIQEETPVEGKEVDVQKKDDSGSQLPEQTAEGGTAGSQFNDGDGEDKSSSEAEKSNERAEEAIQREPEETEGSVNLGEQQSDDKGNTDSQVNGGDEAKGSGKESENSEDDKDLITSTEGNSDSSLDSNNDNENEKIISTEEKPNESNKETQQPDGKAENVSHDEIETEREVHDFHDENGVPEGDVDSSNATKSENSEADTQIQSGETTSTGMESGENATPVSEHSETSVLSDEKSSTSSPSENPNETPEDTDSSRREAVESEGHGGSEAEGTGSGTQQAESTDTGTSKDNENSNKEELESQGDPASEAAEGNKTETTEGEKTESGAADQLSNSSIPNENNIVMPTDTETTETKGVESKADSTSIAGTDGNEPSENASLESNSDNGSASGDGTSSMASTNETNPEQRKEEF